MPPKKDTSEPSEDLMDWSQLIVPLQEPETDEIVKEKDEEVEWEQLLGPLEPEESGVDPERTEQVDWASLHREQL